VIATVSVSRCSASRRFSPMTVGASIESSRGVYGLTTRRAPRLPLAEPNNHALTPIGGFK
jgi:hypothetical protein